MKATRFFWSGVLVMWLAAALFAQEEPKAKPPEDRLLEAELLELSSGDLERAKAIYEALSKDEKTPEAVRARALLYQARSHRKLGELDAARKLLESLIQKQDLERDVLRQARSFLKELQGGKPASAEFDWLRELERNPEIQARVFDLAMEAVDLAANEGRAARQLKALGTIAVPVMEKVLETSRDAQHRQNLALLLLHAGRYERLPIVLDPKFKPRGRFENVLIEFIRGIPTLADDLRARLREAAAAILDADGIADYKHAILFATGDTSRLEEKLTHVEAIWGTNGEVPDIVDNLIEGLPEAPAAMAARILAPNGQKEIRKWYLKKLKARGTEHLKAEHWRVLVSDNPAGSGNPDNPSNVEFLEGRKAFDVLTELARTAGPTRDTILDHFLRRYWHSSTIKQAPIEWARILRAALPGDSDNYDKKPLHMLWLLAEYNDDALAEWRSFLENREKEFVRLQPNDVQMGRDEEHWRPSPAYLSLLIELLETLRDPLALVLVRNAIVFAPADASDEFFSRAEKMLATAEEPELRWTCLSLLYKRFSGKSETGPLFAQVLLKEYEKSLVDEKRAKDAPMPPPAPGLGRTLVPARRAVGKTARGTIPPSSQTARDRIASMLGNVSRSQGFASALRALQPHLLAQATSKEAIELHELACTFCDNDLQRQLRSALIRQLDRVESKLLRESILGPILWPQGKQGFEKDDVPYLEKFFAACVNDRELSHEARVKALCFFERAEQNNVPALLPRFEWVAWAKLFESDDSFTLATFDPPFRGSGNSEHVSEVWRRRLAGYFWTWVHSQPAAERDAIEKAALASRFELVRKRAIGAYPLDRSDAPAVLKKALSDPDESVRDTAAGRLKDATRTDFAPLVLGFLADPRKQYRLFGIEAIQRFSYPESIEPLVKLLDDPETDVREKALDALKKIRDALREKDEWKKIVEGLKKPAAEKREL